jgi:hypothetical protein
MANSYIKVDAGDLFLVSHDVASAADVGVYVEGVKVVGAQEALVANASVAHDLNATFSDTEAEAALDALGTKINAIFTILKNHGLMASS